MDLTRGSVVLLPWILVAARAVAAPPARELDVRRCATVEAAPRGVRSWYVRPDGGDAPACDGQTDRPVSSDRKCAFAHPAAALEQMRGSDRLVIHAGDYPVTSPMAAVPAGKVGAPTRVIGTSGGSGVLPVLRGAGVPVVLELTGGSFVELSCLEITDDAVCIDGHTGKLPCAADARSASIGVRLVDAHDVTLRSLDVHGLAMTGINAGRIADVELEDVRVAGNGHAGWNGEVGRDSRNRGRLRFRRVTFEWNGCAEDARREPTGCWGQSVGGYGDGLGAALTGGSWRFEDCRFLHNTSDGLDLLWHDGDGDIVIDRVWAEGNAGNQIKTRGEVLVQNSVAVGNCGFFSRKPFSFVVDPCRAYGTTLALEPLPGRPQRIVSSTVTTEGDGLVGAAIPPFAPDDRLRAGLPRDACARLTPLAAVNSIFVGGRSFVERQAHRALLPRVRRPRGRRRALRAAELDRLEREVVRSAARGRVWTGHREPVCRSPARREPGAAAGIAGDRDSARAGAPAVDLRGVARPRGRGSDRGALER